MKKASSLEEARRVLDPRPLDFSGDGGDVASRPAYYRELPRSDDGERRRPSVVEKVMKRLRGHREAVFLSGHIGSGKSTQLNRLAARDEVRAEFEVLTLRFEEHERAHLDSAQVVFRIAECLFERAVTLELKPGRWVDKLRALDAEIYGATGVVVPEAKLGAEFDLLFVKVKQELKLDQRRRKQFREFGESQRSVLSDLVAALADGIEEALAKAEEPAKLLLVVDDLDKVRGAESQTDVFDTNLNALLGLPFAVVYTLPTGVAFTGTRPELRRRTVHLYPVEVLRRVDSNVVEDAAREEHLPFFRAVVDSRVEARLFDDDAVRQAALHSGGVLRTFFHLLIEAGDLARYNDLDTVDAISMREALVDARRNESMGLLAGDKAALAAIHASHQLVDEGQRRYLDIGWVLECHNHELWYDASPLLWSLLGDGV